jgi:hypothetical protein
MTGASLRARRVDFGLNFLRRGGRQVQRIELGEGLAQSLGGRITSALLARLQEVDEILHFRTLLRRQRLELLGTHRRSHQRTAREWGASRRLALRATS